MTTGSDTLVSVVAPIRNDAEILAAFVAEVMAVLPANYPNYELVLVDDDSTDRSVAVAEGLLRQYPCIRLIRLARRHGIDLAASAGIESTIGDYVVVIRPQVDPPAEIPAMIASAGDHFGVVIGRAPGAFEGGPILKASRDAFFWLVGKLLGIRLPADATKFCVLTRPVVNAMSRVKSRSRHLGVLSCLVSHSTTFYTYATARRSARRAGRPLPEALNEAISIYVTNSPFPLRLASALGALACGLNFLYVLYVVGINLITRQVAPGWTTMSLQMSGMFFFVFLNLIIISEYVAHIMQESQDRPLYQVLDEKVSTVTVKAAEERRNVA